MFKHEAKFQIGLFLGPAFLGAWAAIILPDFGPYGLMAISIAAIGFGFLLHAKLSRRKRTKDLVSWGPGGMTDREKTSYFLGYILILSFFGISIYLALDSTKVVSDFSSPSQIVHCSKASLKSSVLKKLSKPCGNGKDRFSENLIYTAAFVEASEALVILKKDRDCRSKSIGTEELFCEYFCAHDFAISYLEILRGERNRPVMSLEGLSIFPSGKTVLDVIPFFAKMSDEDLVRSFSEFDTVDTEIKKQNFEKHLFEFAIYFELGKRHSSKAAKRFLFQRLMEVAPIDASGDGGVNQIQEALYQFVGKE